MIEIQIFTNYVNTAHRFKLKKDEIIIQAVSKKNFPHLFANNIKWLDQNQNFFDINKYKLCENDP